MSEPKYTKAFSEYFGENSRKSDIDVFKDQNSRVINLLKDIAAWRAEVVDQTSLDNLATSLQVIEEQINRLYALLEPNPEITKQYIKESLEEGLKNVEESLENLHLTVKKRIVKFNP